MKAGMHIKGLEQVQQALKKEIDKLRAPNFALVGIHESAGMVEDGQMTVATLGAIQHFGNDHIPPRPWLDKGVEAGTKEIITTVREGIADGLDSRQIIDRAGNEAVGAVKDYIFDLKDPPNAASTIKRKGSSNPLIDTQNMRNKVTHKVVRKKSQEGME